MTMMHHHHHRNYIPSEEYVRHERIQAIRETLRVAALRTESLLEQLGRAKAEERGRLGERRAHAVARALGDYDTPPREQASHDAVLQDLREWILDVERELRECELRRANLMEKVEMLEADEAAEAATKRARY